MDPFDDRSFNSLNAKSNAHPKHQNQPFSIYQTTTTTNLPNYETTTTSNLLGQLRNSLEQIVHQPIISDLENGRLRIIVNRHDRFRILHTRQVLNGPRNPNCNVQIWRNDFARLPHLPVVRDVARVDGGSTRTDGRAELIGECFEEAKVLSGLETAPTRDDGGCGGEVGPIGLGFVGLHELREGLGVDVEVRDGDGGRGVAGRDGLVEGGGPDREDLEALRGPNLGQRVAGVHRADEGVLREDLNDVGDGRDVEDGRGAGQHVGAELGGWCENVREGRGRVGAGGLLGRPEDGEGDGLRERVGLVGLEDRRDARGHGGRVDGRGAGGEQSDGSRVQLLGGREGRERRCCHAAVVRGLGDHQRRRAPGRSTRGGACALGGSSRQCCQHPRSICNVLVVVWMCECVTVNEEIDLSVQSQLNSINRNNVLDPKLHSLLVWDAIVDRMM